MKNYWDYEALEEERYYKYFTQDEWQKYSTCKLQLKSLHPQKIFERKKRDITRIYENILSQDATDKFLNSEPVREIILDNIPELESKCEKIKQDYTLDSFREHLDKLSLNKRKKIRQLCEPAEHFEKRGRFIIRILVPLMLTLLFFIIFNLLGVTFQNATDTVYFFTKILIDIFCIAFFTSACLFVLLKIDFSSDGAKIIAAVIAIFISIALFAGCAFLCDKYINPTQKVYDMFSMVMTVILFGISFVISEISSAPVHIMKYICNNSSAFKEDTNSRYCEYLLKGENMEIIAISLYLDDILRYLTETWIEDNHLQTLESNYLKMKQLIDTAKERADTAHIKQTDPTIFQPSIFSGIDRKIL